MLELIKKHKLKFAFGALFLTLAIIVMGYFLFAKENPKEEEESKAELNKPAPIEPIGQTPTMQIIHEQAANTVPVESAPSIIGKHDYSSIES